MHALAAGDLTVDACVFDEFAPGDFELRDPSTIQRSTLRRCTPRPSPCAGGCALQCSVLPCVHLTGACRTIVSPSRGSSAMEELFPRSADLPIVNDAFDGRSDYRCCNP